MTTLLQAACAALEDAHSSASTRAMAAEALLVGMQLGVEMPARAVWLAWTWMRGLPANRAWNAAEKLAGIPDPRVRADALSILDASDVGDELLDLATNVLSGSGHAAHIDDAILMRVVDRAQSDERVRQAGELLMAVQRAREVPASLLRVVRERWMASSSAEARQTSVMVASQLSEPDLTFVAQMMDDPSADVRMAVSDRIARGLLGGVQSLEIVEERLRIESHEEARSALLHAQAALISRGAAPT